MITRKIRVGTPKGTEGGLPSVVAIPKNTEGPIVCGREAVEADPNDYERLYNWKMLLGLTIAELAGEAARNSALARCLELMTIDDLVLEFFRSSLSLAITDSDTELRDLQLIVGIPPSTNTEAKRWRENYKRRIASALQSIGFGRPRVWPEPFAVFQYTKNLGEIRDVGAHQNVLVVDVGGGTTNVCLIQTTQHGRLARGGINHVPHGVRSIEVAGATLDLRLAEELLNTSDPLLLENLLPQVKDCKEQISTVLSDTNTWESTELLAKATSKIPVSGTEVLELTGTLVREVFTDKVWPAISAIIDESLQDVLGGQLSNPVHEIDVVILAGGTGQMGLFRHLFQESIGTQEALRSAIYAAVPDYQSAVAHGLAIEAAANSRHHGIMPARVSAFLQEDIRFRVGLRNGELETPQRLTSKSNLSSRLRSGVLIEAPTDIVSLVGRPIDWRFYLRQKSPTIYYELAKVDEESTDVLCTSWKRIARAHSQLPGRQLYLNMRLGEDGFAHLNLTTIGEDRTRVSHALDPIDFHDLSGLEGDVFFGLDFGTDNTQTAYVNVTDPSIFEAMPNEYRWQPQIERYARELEEQARDLLRSNSNPAGLLQRLNDQSLTDYVYHSNRIEGSLLGRGETGKLLTSADDTTAESAKKLESSIRMMGVISAEGEILPADRIVSDHLAAINLRDAFKYMEEIANDPDRLLTAFHLKELHALVMKGSDEHSPGRYRNHIVSISQTSFVPPDFVQVEPLMEQMFSRFSQPSFQEQPALLKATEAHARFVSVHPFGDGNGRVARLIANYFLWGSQLPGLLLPWENRDRYYDALEECNSKEVGAWGDLTDLLRVFCDVFTDTLEFLRPDEEERVEEDRELGVENVVVDQASRENSVSRLMKRLSASNAALSAEEQYEDWKNNVEGISAEVREYSGQISRLFRSEWGGSLEVRGYDLIDRDTYHAIRRRQRHSRTWYMKLLATLPDSVEELVFYFGPNSRVARQLEPTLAFTCSMHMSQLDRTVSRHLDVGDTNWSRVGELTHDGSSPGILLRESAGEPFRHFVDATAETASWYGTLVEDLILNFSDFELAEEPR